MNVNMCICGQPAYFLSLALSHESNVFQKHVFDVLQMFQQGRVTSKHLDLPLH